LDGTDAVLVYAILEGVASDVILLLLGSFNEYRALWIHTLYKLITILERLFWHLFLISYFDQLRYVPRFKSVVH